MIELEFRQAIESATARLVSVAADGDLLSVNTGSVYPSGGPVIVDVRQEGDGCFITDSGRASLEAELLGATPRLFIGQGKTVAEQMGVSFDHQSFFAVRVDVSRVLGAIKIIGTASLKAATLTEARMSEQAEKNDRADLIDRLLGVFGPRRVAKDYDIIGASTHAWSFAGRVSTDGVGVLFDCTGPQHISVYSTHAKFSDVARLESDAPGRVVTYSQRYEMKADYRNLLQQTASLIEIEEEDSTYEKVVV